MTPERRKEIEEMRSYFDVDLDIGHPLEYGDAKDVLAAISDLISALAEAEGKLAQYRALFLPERLTDVPWDMVERKLPYYSIPAPEVVAIEEEKP